MSVQAIFRMVILFGMMLSCISCTARNHHHKSNETMIIELKPTVFNLYYSDFINPIRTIPVRNTEAEGMVLEKKFEYGKTVKKGQLLFVIVSKELARNYFDAVRQYVRSAESLATAQYQMEGEEYLNKLKIVSEQEYKTVKSQLFNAKLDYADSLDRLAKVLEQEEGTDSSILEKIQNKSPQAIYDILTKLPKINLFEVYAPESGVTLIPSEEGGQTSKKPPRIGSVVKASQELTAIADMSGISVTVKLPENYIDKIKEGQKAIITGDAFPGISLEGKVIFAGRQSMISDGSSTAVPLYAVTIAVPNISKEVQNIIRVGMSANVEFRLESIPVINIPITAVFKKGNQAYVKKIDPKSQKTVEVEVQTGRTSVNSIEITEGLKDKDEVLVNASSD